MFRLRPEARATVRVSVDGRMVALPEGASAAAAMLAAGLPAIRETPVTGAGRLPYCMMGVCFDCLVTVDGVGNRQGCLVRLRPGMQVETQRGRREVGR